MTQRHDIAGVVLAGGRSRRFGSNKAQALHRGRRLIDHALDALEGACSELIVATDRPEIFQGIGRALVVRDVIPERGPLGGIVTAFRRSEKRLLLVLGCDIVAGAEAIGALFSAGAGPARVAEIDGRPQYLCGIYSRELLAHFEDCIRRGVLSVGAALAEVHGVVFVAVPPAAIANINTPDDLIRAGERMADHAP